MNNKPVRKTQAIDHLDRELLLISRADEPDARRLNVYPFDAGIQSMSLKSLTRDVLLVE